MFQMTQASDSDWPSLKDAATEDLSQVETPASEHQATVLSIHYGTVYILSIVTLFEGGSSRHNESWQTAGKAMEKTGH